MLRDTQKVIERAKKELFASNLQVKSPFLFVYAIKCLERADRYISYGNPFDKYETDSRSTVERMIEAGYLE